MNELQVLLHTLYVNFPYFVGFFMPPLVQILNRDVQKEGERYVVSIVVCMIVASILNWNKLLYGDLTQILTSTGLIFLESNMTYTRYFAKSGMRADLIKLIGGTSELQDPLSTKTVVLPQQKTEEGTS